MKNSGRPLMIAPLFIFLTSSLLAQQESSNVWSAEVYPNPSEGIVNVRLTGLYDELTHINIVNSEGKSVFSENVYNDQNHTLDLSTLPKGIYTIQMMSTNVYMKQPLVIM